MKKPAKKSKRKVYRVIHHGAPPPRSMLWENYQRDYLHMIAHVQVEVPKTTDRPEILALEGALYADYATAQYEKRFGKLR